MRGICAAPTHSTNSWPMPAVPLPSHRRNICMWWPMWSQSPGRRSMQSIFTGGHVLLLPGPVLVSSDFHDISSRPLQTDSYEYLRKSQAASTTPQEQGAGTAQTRALPPLESLFVIAAVFVPPFRH